MVETILRCPVCEAVLKAGEKARQARRGRCPKCRHVVTLEELSPWQERQMPPRPQPVEAPPAAPSKSEAASAETVRCPHCTQRLRPPEHLRGQLGRCSSCLQAFTIPAAAPPDAPAPRPKPPTPRRGPAASPVGEKRESYVVEPSAEPPVEERPRRRPVAATFEERKPRTALWRWRKVRTGMTLMCVATGLLAGAAFLKLILTVTFQAEKAGALQGGALTVGALSEMLGLFLGIGVLIVLLTVAAEVLSVVGYSFCLLVPSRHGAFGLALTTLILTFSSWFLILAAIVLTPYLLLGTLLLFGARWFLFSFFLRAVALGLKEYGLAESIEKLLFLWAGLIGAALLMGFLLKSVLQSGMDPDTIKTLLWGFSIVRWIMGLVSLLGFAWYVQVVFQTRGAVSERVGA